MDTRLSTSTFRTKSSPAVMIARFALLAVLVTGALGLLAACRTASATPPKAPVATTTHLTFDILPVKPGGPAESYPAYMATSATALPTNTVVTVTIRNFDLGDDSVAAGSPLLSVQGTTDGTATMDGKSYTSLDAKHISHTFTIPQLNLNIPISGDPVGDANNVTVTFSFRTPQKAGTYTFQCFVPCGTGSNGFDGPMSTLGYMRGTVTVVA